jgi:hypothetical protein
MKEVVAKIPTILDGVDAQINEYLSTETDNS